MASRENISASAGNLENIISAYYEQIYRFCYWKIHDRVEAQDIAQDTFLRFLEAAQTYSDIEKPKALLYTIANRLCLNWLKKVRPVSLDASENSDVLTALDFADESIRKIALSSALSLLPDKQQEVLLLRYGQALEVNEIAEILDLSRFQVMYRIRNALNQLKRILEKEGGM